MPYRRMFVGKSSEDWLITCWGKPLH